ncbi:MAG: GyrI-like domain-containing protein [Maribacter sp.]
MIKPIITQLEEKKLVGQYVTMSLAKNRTGALWSGFMPRRNEIENRVGVNFFSMQVFPTDYHLKFNPERLFQKWATVEVTNFESIPEDMEVFILKTGLYAVFDYKGSSTDPTIFQYIYNEWLPNSEYELDDRPHFEVLGTKYRNNDPNSEEEIWIPIKQA